MITPQSNVKPMGMLMPSVSLRGFLGPVDEEILVCEAAPISLCRVVLTWLCEPVLVVGLLAVAVAPLLVAAGLSKNARPEL